jgi:hypothetical protein
MGASSRSADLGAMRSECRQSADFVLMKRTALCGPSPVDQHAAALAVIAAIRAERSV